MRLEKDDAKIGLLVFATLALFLGLLFQRSLRAMLNKEFQLQLRVDHAGDLTEGTEVQLQGLRVGQVQAVRLLREGVEYRFLAELGLRNDIVLWQGTRAQVVAKPLGGSFVDLQLPPVPARLAILPPHSTLTGSTGASLATLVDGSNTLVANLNSGVAELRGHLQERGMGAVLEHPQVAQVFKSLFATLRGFEQVARDSQGLLRHGETSLTAMDRSLARMDQSLIQVEHLLTTRGGDLDAGVKHLAGAMQELETLGHALNGLVQQSGPNGAEAVKALERNLRATEELLELLKAKPSRAVWGTPGAAEREAAARKVQEARKAQGAKP